MGNTVRNAGTGLVLQAVQVATQFACRTVFIHTMSEGYLGVNGLCTNILNILSLAELGFGSAFVCRLYGPLRRGDTGAVSAAMAFFRKAYRMVALAIACMGLATLPFFRFIVKDPVPGLRWFFLLHLADVAGCYLFTYRALLIEADQKQYVVSWYSKGFACARNLLQVAGLVCTGNMYVYLAIQFVTDVGANIVLARKAGRMYPYLGDGGELPAGFKEGVFSGVRDVALHKVGAVAVNYTDSIILSAMAGLSACGVYSNYALITSNLRTFLNILTESTRAGFGDLAAAGDMGRLGRRMSDLFLASSYAYGLASVCMYVLFTPFITMWAGEAYLFGQGTVAWIVAAFYIEGVRQPVLITKDALGLFHGDRFKGIVCAVLNIALSVLFVLHCGTGGVFAGTAVSTAVAYLYPETHVLYSQGLHGGAGRYWLRFAASAAVTVAAAAVCSLAPAGWYAGIPGFLRGACLCTAAYTALFLAAFRGDAVRLAGSVLRTAARTMGHRG